MTSALPASAASPARPAEAPKAADGLAVLRSALAPDYELERELGRGGMGIVFAARDVRLDRPVAIKILPPHDHADEPTRERFLREARTAAQLSHPNVVPIYRADEAQGCAFFVMALIEGESLGDRIRERAALPPAEAVPILRDVAWALAYAHTRGVIHRDVKPENIMIERGSNRALVTDFGIARDLRATPITDEGYVLGTAHYMSPEQIADDVVDGRSDLYALGVVAYLLLSGRLPFEAETASAVLMAHAAHDPPRLREVAPHVPERLAELVDRCLEKRPDDRFASCVEFAEALGNPSDWRASAAPGAASTESVTEEQAAAIWRRAAQLQAEASQRLQRRLTNPSERLRRDPSTGDGFRLDQVTTAAVEAGIGPEYVALAVAEQSELRGEARTSAPTDLSPIEQRYSRRLLHSRDASVSVSRVIAGSPREVLTAIGAVFQEYPWELRLRETVGAHPLDGGVMVFDIPSLDAPVGGGGSFTTFRMVLGSLGERQLRVTLHRLKGDRPACEVTVYGDLREAIKRSARWIVPVAGIGAIAGGVGAWAVVS
ncbi:MAG TPA: protein kinase, partial [Gemmatimonadaceae bacterium]|nr:protein kinase [Gemmatimonadaceae bacterium]